MSLRITGMIAIFFLYASAGTASEPAGHITYTLSTQNSTTPEGKEAYARIKIAMDSALYYYNTYTSLSKKLTVTYEPSVQTADGNFNGSIRFGSNKSYQVTCTAMHEIAHTIGVGTTSQWSGLIKNNVYIGKNASAKLKEIDSPDAVLKGDNQHFWPYGLNYASEVKSEKDLINHCLIVNEIFKDLFPTVVFEMENNGRQSLGDGELYGKVFFFGAYTDHKIEAAVFNLAGRRISDYSIGDNRGFSKNNSFRLPVTGGYVYRICKETVKK